MNSAIEKKHIREKIIDFLKLLVNQKENINYSPINFYEMLNLKCGLDIFIQNLKELGIWSFKTINKKNDESYEKDQIIYKININVLENHLKKIQSIILYKHLK
jgi:hypothetical protein